MFKNRRVLAVIPARGGSKGIKLKNLQIVAGKSLVGWVGSLLTKTNLVDRKVISTDHEGIANEARRYEIEVPFMRPASLSGDFVSDLDVLVHALIETERIYNEQYEIITMLQPTSPSRTIAHIESVLTKLVDEQLDSVWTVSPTDLKFHPLKQLNIRNDGLLDFFLEGGRSIVARQQLETIYHRNGICYAFTRSCLLQQRAIMGRRTGAIVIREIIPNIDSLEDLAYAEEFILKTCPQ
jgi:CMP-N,N'-diacetyllegionaminic acid synthase